jgi:hypothetical protein
MRLSIQCDFQHVLNTELYAQRQGFLKWVIAVYIYIYIYIYIYTYIIYFARRHIISRLARKLSHDKLVFILT